MIIFLYGPDDFRRHQRKKFYIEEYKKKHSGLGIGRFDFSEEGAGEKFSEFMRNRSMFDSFKMAILENIFAVSAERSGHEAELEALMDELKLLVESGKETTILISEVKKPTKNFNFLLREPVIAELFETLEGYEWELFVRREAKARGVNFTNDALVFLATVYAGDSWRAVTELEKLRFLEKDSVETHDLENLGLEITPNFWGLMSALRSPDVRRRLPALERIFAENEPAAKVFNILSAQWPEKLPQMAQYDIAVKSGKLEYEEVLVDVVL